MPHAGSINPKTGKRYNFVDPRQEERDLHAIEKDIALLERQKMALEARDNLLTYTHFTMPDPEAPNDVHRSRYQAARFHELIAEVFDEFYGGTLRLDSGAPCTQLIFVMPPRHGKTEMATKRAAAKYSGNNPSHNVAVASYSDTMAEDMGADTRAILTTAQHKQVFPTYRLRRGGSAKSNIQTEQGGRLVFVGRGGALTGRGAHLLLIDDIFKDHEEARSSTIRDQAWNWFTKVAMTRRMGRKLVVVTMTRWHSDDVIGRLTDPENPHYNAIESSKWKIIRLPAIAEEDDPLGREPGEPLWPNGPDKFDLDFLQSQQRLDPLGFSALYQQSPTVADGVLFQRETIQYYSPDQLPDQLRFYCASDHAVKEKQRNDPSCFLKVGVDRQDNIYIIDCIWRRMATDKAVEAMLAMGGGNMRPLLWWAENGHISGSIGPFLRKRMQETRTYINIVEVTPKEDKAQRAQSIAARVAMGKVYWPKVSWWTEKSINELMAFPNGTRDDFVDALAYIGLGLQSQFGPSAAPAKPKPAEGTFGWLKRNDEWAEARKRAASAGGFG
ncbi:phage terminase large subunit [Mesorhizobium sp. ESP7-2]|uniref:phage terminase large subunit n=1 Tax=Mesorhizobium sp. ESP7-2 TaxID=2876622 RepID=UPI001CCABE18|nr:phage terminase large subunit [Mesorhizobium sp. ESP7-2]MBZ9706073.1 phage terminase large subunit [Mesorhizobium sp. ESP7-2]